MTNVSWTRSSASAGVAGHPQRRGVELVEERQRVALEARAALLDRLLGHPHVLPHCRGPALRPLGRTAEFAPGGRRRPYPGVAPAIGAPCRRRRRGLARCRPGHSCCNTPSRGRFPPPSPTTAGRAPPTSRRSEWSPGTATIDCGPGGATRAGVPNGSRSPCTTSTGTASAGELVDPDFVRPVRAGAAGRRARPLRRRRRRGAVRQATRAPLLRPPTTSAPPRDRQRSATTTATNAASSRGAGPGARRPLTRYGCSTLATVQPAATSAAVTATRSGASIPPPAP